tara:strand:+ start:43 stop:414 length:372 start_codon:yes stop_codon:yes gene_type:complete
MAELAKQDQLIEQLQCEINHRKEKINKQFRDVASISNSNKYLDGVANDYQKYYGFIKNERSSQKKYLEMILDYLDRLILEEKLSTEALKHARSEQRRTMGEINNIKGELDEIMSLSNIYDPSQ